MRLERIRKVLLRKGRRETQLDVTCLVPLDPSEVDPELAERAKELFCSLVWAELPDGRRLIAGLQADGALVDLASGEILEEAPGEGDITIDLAKPEA